MNKMKNISLMLEGLHMERTTIANHKNTIHWILASCEHYSIQKREMREWGSGVLGHLNEREHKRRKFAKRKCRGKETYDMRRGEFETIGNGEKRNKYLIW